MPVPVLSLLAGRVRPLARGEGSAIAKAGLDGVVTISLQGIAGDEQADRKHHGGRDKALHHYPHDHYARWKQSMPDHPQLERSGAFGENISTLGLMEDDVCIGDRLRLGTALLEISQAREPCWKQGEQLNWTILPSLMVKERRSGWYYRVIEPGEARAGDSLSLVERPLPQWTVKRVFAVLIGGEYKRDRAALRALADMPLLFEGWRERARALEKETAR